MNSSQDELDSKNEPLQKSNDRIILKEPVLNFLDKVTSSSKYTTTIDVGSTHSVASSLSDPLEEQPFGEEQPHFWNSWPVAKKKEVYADEIVYCRWKTNDSLKKDVDSSLAPLIPRRVSSGASERVTVTVSHGRNSISSAIPKIPVRQDSLNPLRRDDRDMDSMTVSNRNSMSSCGKR